MDHAEAAARVEEMYVEYHGTVRDYLFRLTRNPHLADDLASETFERAMRHLLRRDAPTLETPIAWLKAVARNLLTDHYRRAANRNEVASANIAEGMEDVVSADCGVMASEALAEAHRLMESLTPGQRAVVVLRALHDLSTHETAEAMGRTPQAVRSLRHKAMRRLAAARRESLEAADE